MRIVFETPQTLCLEPSSSVSDGCGQTVQRRVEPLKVFRFRNGATPYGFVTSPFQSGKEERGAMPCLHHTVPISGISSRRIRCSTRLRKAKKSRRRNSLKKKNVRYFSDVNIAGMVKSAFRPCECHGVGVLLVSDCSFASRPRRNFSPDTMKHGIENFGVSNRSEFDFRGTIHNESASDFFTGMCTFLCL